MDINSYRVDLHVHTPASKDYAGNMDVSEYKAILKMAKANNVDVIGVSDHNSFDGYVAVKKVIDESREFLRLAKTQDYMTREQLASVEDEFRIFESLLILPAVEVKLYPGIHYVVVFDDDVDLELVCVVFEELSNGEFIRSKGEEGFLFRQRPDQFFSVLSEHFKGQFFVYAPHADSSSGLLEVLKEAREERLRCLNEPALCAIGVNKKKTVSYLRGDLFRSLSRKRQLCIVNDSDYHGRRGEKVGSGFFIVESSRKISFAVIKDSLESGDIQKTFLDVASDMYEEFKKNKNPIYSIALDDIEKISDEEIERSCVYVCAALNSERGCVEFQINTFGVDDEKAFVQKRIEQLHEYFEKRLNYVPSGGVYSVIPTGKNNQSVFFEFDVSLVLTLYNNLCYVFNSENNPNIASSDQIESIVARKIYYRYGKAKDRAIKRVSDESFKIKNSLLAFSIACKNRAAIQRTDEFERIFFDIQNIDEQSKGVLKELINGEFAGGVVYIDRKESENSIRCGRYHSSYLRFSPPSYPGLSLASTVDKFESVCEGDIIVSIRGAVHVVLVDSYFAPQVPCIVLRNKEKAFKPHCVAAWMKSTFFQWYLSKVLHFGDVFEYIFSANSFNFMMVNGVFESAEIETEVKNILLKEKKFLSEEKKIRCRGKLTQDAIESNVMRHNESCDKDMLSIDSKIFKLLDIEKREIEMIYRDIRELNVYDYGCVNSFEQIFG